MGMYDSLIYNYWVAFEGALAPVFYKSFYPTGFEDDNMVLKAFHDYARGLKSDGQSKDWDNRCYDAYAQEYEEDLWRLLERFENDVPGHRLGVVVIPSSTVGRVNRVTELVRRVVAGSELASTIADLTWCLQRTQSKAKAHSGGTRSVSKNLDTLLVDPDARVQDYHAILVIDDITTTGNSFLAADSKLREAGFEGKIVNFAFARTCSSEAIHLFKQLEWGGCPTGRIKPLTTKSPASPEADPNREEVGYRVSFHDGSVRDFEGGYTIVERAHYGVRTRPDSLRSLCFDSHYSVQFGDGQIVEFDSSDDFEGRVRRIIRMRKIGGVVFDFDDTLVSDTPRNLEYEEHLHGDGGWNASEGVAIPCPYVPYPGVRDFMSLGIPFAVVSNRPLRAVRSMVDDPVINDSIYPGRMAREGRTLEEWRSSGSRSYPLELLRGKGTAPNQYEDLFSYPSKQVDGFDKTVRFYKPCPQGVLQAVQHIRSTAGLEADARIVGVGNTLEDIIAYKAAGIESVLALWGVPDYLREHAERRWGADYSFGSMAEFGRWCECGVHGTTAVDTRSVVDLYGKTTSARRVAHRNQDDEPTISRKEPSIYKVYFDKSLLPEGVIHWMEAASHLGETVSIYGEVESTYFDWEDYERNIAAYQMGADPKPTFIEVGEKYPSERLVKIVIWGRDRGRFGEPPDSYFKGRAVIFTGKPYVYDGITTVQISDPESIHIVGRVLNYYRDDSNDEELDRSDYILIDEGPIVHDDEDHFDDYDSTDCEPDPADSPLHGWHFDEDNGWLDFYPEE